jgi:DDE family transposase
MNATAADSLLSAFQQLTDPRDRRGVRHPFAGLLAVVFLGLLSRQADFASIARWAKRHWTVLKPAFGLTRTYAPHETTYSRAAARFSVDQFRSALTLWLARAMTIAPITAAVDGKTSKQADDADGDPIHVLNVFAHGANVCLADWPVGEGKDTEPEVLKAHLDELFASWPSLRVLTGDAIFCQRPLAHAIIAGGRDYVLAIKDNQPDLHETARTAFADATADSADATVCEKNAGRSRSGASGVTRRRPTTRGRR